MGEPGPRMVENGMGQFMRRLRNGSDGGRLFGCWFITAGCLFIVGFEHWNGAILFPSS